MTPTQRSLAHLHKAGYIATVCERYIAAIRHREDLFGIGDIIAILGTECLLVQTTTGSNVAAHVKLYRDDPVKRASLSVWLSCGSRRWFEIHGWGKRGPRGKGKLWSLRRLCAVNGRDGVEFVEQ